VEFIKLVLDWLKYQIGGFKMYIKCDPVKVHSPENVADVFRSILKSECEVDQEKEHFWVMGLNTKNKVLYIELVSLGTINESIAHPREVFRSAIMKGVTSILFCHNHPSGEPEPSEGDITTTERLKKGGELLGIKVLDHIIIGDKDLYSFKTEGLI